MTNITEVKSTDLSKLTPAGIKAIKVAVVAGTRAETTLRTCAEQLRADGIVSTCFISPASKSGLGTASAELFKALKAAVAEGMPPATKKAFFLEGKQSKDQADAKRKAAGAVSSRMSKVMAHLESLEGIVKATPERGAQQSSGETSDAAPAKQIGVTKEIELLNRINKIAQGKEEPEYDVIAVTAALAELLKLINTPVEPKH
jgi:hypothetical protein